MKKNIRIIIKLLALLMVVVGGSAITWKLMDYHKGAMDYTEAAQLAGISKPSVQPQPTSGSQASQLLEEDSEPLGPEAPPKAAPTPDPYAQELAQVDLNALRQVNPQVTGWIAIPGTNVFYPVMYTDNNTHYLNYTWKNENSGVGAIFLETSCQPDFSDFNTIIYGHQMMDGSMFGGLQKFSDQAYAQERPYVYIARDGGVVEKYQIFAAFEVGVRDLIYRLDIEEENMQQKLIDFCKEHSVIDLGVDPQADGRLITLSTCTGWGYSTRWVVVASWVPDIQSH